MTDDLTEKPPVPEGWIEFEYSDPDPDAVQEELQKQQRHKLHKPVESGVDEERGPYDVIPLAMVLGGEAKPTTVFKTPMKHMVLDQGIPPRGWYKNAIEGDRVRPRPCLLPDAKVNTPDGVKEIRQLKVGDKVIGYDEKECRIVATTVQAVMSQTKSEYLVLQLSNRNTLKLTPEHLVYLVDGWIEADQIVEDVDNLMGLSGAFDVYVQSVRRVEYSTTVYDIQTGTHNFFAEGVLVHNCYTEALLTSPWGGYCPVGCSFCLEGHTVIMDGYGDVNKMISELRPGDYALGIDGQGDYVPAQVIAVSKRVVHGYYHLASSDGSKLAVTGNHPVYTKQGWLAVERLELGQEIMVYDEEYTNELNGKRLPASTFAKVVMLDYVDKSLEVWDIQTSTENFFAEGVLVHNCYINNGSRGYRATGIPTVDPDYPEKYAKQLKRMMVAGAGYMTSFSEIFHVLEDKHHVAERLTQVFVDENLPIFYCTRRLPMEFAIEALQKNPYSYMQFSINTSNPDDYRKLSPGAAKLDEYYKMIQRLHSLGIYISIQCNPIHPGITSLEELKQLVRNLASVGTDHIIFKFVEQVMNTRKVIVDRLASRRFDPKKVDLFDKLFNQVIGGVYTIQQDVRIEWLEELLAETRANHMTMSTCYEYYENGKAGANLAPYFTTSDQCHGRGVPIHYRPAPGAKFQPLPGCYRKGCLYCADYGTRACRSETLLEAKALEYKDLVSTVITGREADWDMAESCARPELEHANPNANPGYLTDAELWGWIPRYTPEAKIGQFVPAQAQHSGSKEMLDLEDATSLQ